MDDLISRQAAIEEMHNIVKQTKEGFWEPAYIPCVDVFTALKQLPSAQPDLTAEEWKLIKQLRSYHNGSYAQVLDKLITSKQTGRDNPVKPDKTIDHAWGIKSVQAVCPKCDCYLGAVYFLGDGDKKITYCERCGQAIDWSEWEWDAERREE